MNNAILNSHSWLRNFGNKKLRAGKIGIEIGFCSLRHKKDSYFKKNRNHSWNNAFL